MEEPPISQPSLEELTKNGSNNSEIVAKPSTISLQPLSGNASIPKKSINQSQPSLPPSSISPTHSEITGNSLAMVQVKSRISVEKIQQELSKSLAKTLYMKPSDIDIEKSFIDMGLDSIIGVEWRKVLEKQFGLSISIEKVYEYSSIFRLSKFLKKELKKQSHPLPEKSISDTSTAPPRKGQKSSISSGPNIKSVNLKESIRLSNPYRKNHQRSIRSLKNRGIISPPFHKMVNNPTLGSIPESSIERSSSKMLDIAVIGLTGRYPLANNLEEYWKNLCEGKDCITEIPKDRWDHSLYFDKDRTKIGKTSSNWGGFLEGIDQFDPLFFNISPREAQNQDPNERLFLEAVWTLLESAGYTRDILKNQYESRVGVYVGSMYQHYQAFGIGTGSIANRISYYFGFQGPSIALDTMCSSSAIAIHMACESLGKKECRIAIAGGVNLTIRPEKYLALSQLQMNSSQIHVRSFGEGDGIIPAEAVGAVLLKSLSKSIEDRDPILAVIKSTATNHGGRSDGFTVPNADVQTELIVENFIKSGIDPRTISYVEAAANGSPLGDPIEVAALTKAFRKFTKDQHYCSIGSVKSNIGHAEAASGISQLTKVVLQLNYRQLVPSIKATPLNTNISFDQTPFYLQQTLQEWKRPIIKFKGEECEIPRRATVSSFGAGGSYANLIIEEYQDQLAVSSDQLAASSDPLTVSSDPLTVSSDPLAVSSDPLTVSSDPLAVSSDPLAVRDQKLSENDPVLITLSAKDEERLMEIASNLVSYLTRQGEASDVNSQQLQNVNLNDIAYTLQVGREAMEERIGIIARSSRDLVVKLKAFIDDQGDVKELFRGQVKRFKDAVAVFEADEELRGAINQWVQRKKYKRLLELWVKGLTFDWNRLYGKSKPRRVILPTYPFARERYWISHTSPVQSSFSKVHRPSPFLHPLVHENTSNF